MPNFDDDKMLKCSFCGKPQNRVRKLIAGPGVYICDECIELCGEILEEENWTLRPKSMKWKRLDAPNVCPPRRN